MIVFPKTAGVEHKAQLAGHVTCLLVSGTLSNQRPLSGGEIGSMDMAATTRGCDARGVVLAWRSWTGWRAR